MEVQQQRLLAAIEVLVLLIARVGGTSAERKRRRQRIRLRGVDLDHVGAVLAKDPTGAGSSDDLREVQHAHACERLLNARCRRLPETVAWTPPAVPTRGQSRQN